jgi:hypothetical protein
VPYEVVTHEQTIEGLGHLAHHCHHDQAPIEGAFGTMEMWSIGSLDPTNAQPKDLNNVND